MGEPLGIRFEAIEFILDIYSIFDVELRRELFEKILKIDEIRISKRKK